MLQKPGLLRFTRNDGRVVLASGVKQSGSGTPDCFVSRKDDRNPLNLRQSELKTDVVKCTRMDGSFPGTGG
ncbi:MAG: hypothetical protein LBS88_05780 [Tannerellaceae bacterium]|nr:hypothetical protein [Tannerellaceae bacterium]